MHFPWCLSKCAYCDFPSRPFPSSASWPAYLDALIREIEARAQGAVETLYLGGGTPSMCPPSELARLFAALSAKVELLPSLEATLEANPATVSPDALADLRAVGFNRLSLGVQSTSDRYLQLLGRRHTAADAQTTLRGARGAGFANLSVDLIYGLPGQTFAEFQTDLRTLTAWEPEHISLYALSVEPGTLLETAVREGRMPAPDEDLAADMYLWAREFLAGRGFAQYELSNFSRPGRECRHNLGYWTGRDYFGFGAAAHSFLEGVRSWNIADPEAYQTEVNREGCALAGQEKLTGSRRVAEAAMLGLRLTAGLQPEDMRARFGTDWDLELRGKFEAVSRQGLISMNKDDIRLTPRGMLLSNVVFREMI
ncbi:MAG: radical SAM family heme chaperone HemW [candidate division FCPU426 bacterium]